MKNVQSLTESLLSLRRYARAVSASAVEGDKCIEVFLESILTGTIQLATSEHGPVKEAFRELDRLLCSDDFGISRLATSTIDRRALLLVTMEEFTHEDAADILGVPASAIPELLKVAEDKLKSSLATSIMIIEDETLIARHLGSIMQEIGHDVVAYATTHDEAFAKAREKCPQLILADIKLADGSLGTDAAEDIWSMFPDLPIIFVTAYPEIFLTGDKQEPDFLIPKPFRTEYVQAVVSQALLSQALGA